MCDYRQVDMVSWICLILILVGVDVLKAEPCTDYTMINDTTLLTTYQPTDVAHISCPTFAPFKWYRYTGTDDGLLTRVCPERLQCGSHTQLWLNDNFPTSSEGERSVHVCVHKGTSCCNIKNKMDVKNCSNYMVYKFLPNPSCFNYCFDSPPVVVKVTGGAGGGTTGTDGRGSTKAESKWKTPVAVCLSGLFLAVFVVGILIYKKKYKRRVQAKSEELYQCSDTVRNEKFTGLPPNVE